MKKYILLCIVATMLLLLALSFYWKYYYGNNKTCNVESLNDFNRVLAQKEISLSGNIVDEQGMPVNDVMLEITKGKMTDLIKMRGVEEKEQIKVNSVFSLKFAGFHVIYFKFSKEGYYPVEEKLTTISASPKDNPNKKENLKIVMRKAGEFVQLKQGWMMPSLKTDEDGKVLKKGWVYKARENEKHGVFDRMNNIPYDDPTEVDVYLEEDKDGKGLWLIANGENGFTEPFEAVDFTYLPEAPEDGYAKRIFLPFIPLEEGEEDCSRRSKPKYCYFKLQEGVYGKMSVEATQNSDKTKREVSGSYYINPKSSRNLRSKNSY